MDPEQAYYRAHARLSRVFIHLFSDGIRDLFEITCVSSAIILLLVLACMHTSFVGQPGCASEFSSVDFVNSHLVEIKITGVWNDVEEDFLLNFQKHSSLSSNLLRRYKFLWSNQIQKAASVNAPSNQTEASNSTQKDCTGCERKKNDSEVHSLNASTQSSPSTESTHEEGEEEGDSVSEFENNYKNDQNNLNNSEMDSKFCSSDEYNPLKPLFFFKWFKNFKWKHISTCFFNTSKKFCVFYGTLFRTCYATFKITVKKFWGAEEASINDPLGLFWRLKFLFFDYFNTFDDTLKHFTVDPTYIFSTEKGYLILSDTAKNKTNLKISKVFISAQNDCFGSPWKRLLIDYFVGYDTILMNSIIKAKGNEKGYLHNIQTKELYTLDHYHDNNMNNEYTKFYVSKFGVFITSLFIYFTTTTSISFTLRQTQMQMLTFTALLQYYARNELPTFHLFFSHICALFIFVPMMIGVLFFLFEFYNDQLLAFMFFTLVWICEIFSMISMQTTISKFFFPKFVFLYIMLFNIYIFSFNHGFSYLAFFTCFVFNHHLVYYFWKYYEFPALMRQRLEPESTDQVRSSFNQLNRLVNGGSENVDRGSENLNEGSRNFDRGLDPIVDAGSDTIESLLIRLRNSLFHVPTFLNLARRWRLNHDERGLGTEAFHEPSPELQDASDPNHSLGSVERRFNQGWNGNIEELVRFGNGVVSSIGGDSNEDNYNHIDNDNDYDNHNHSYSDNHNDNDNDS